MKVIREGKMRTWLFSALALGFLPGCANFDLHRGLDKICADEAQLPARARQYEPVSILAGPGLQIAAQSSAGPVTADAPYTRVARGLEILRVAAGGLDSKLQARELPHAVVQPLEVRKWALALGYTAETDNRPNDKAMQELENARTMVRTLRSEH